MKWVAVSLLLMITLGINSSVEPASSAAQDEHIEKLIQALYTHPWPGAEMFAEPMEWDFHFTEPIQALLEIGAAAQKPLLARLSDPAITDQVIFLLGGVGDEESVGPIIAAMEQASNLPAEKRKRILEVGNLALTNITVADIIWHHGGGIVLDRCPDDPAQCWAQWWKQNKATFRVRDIKQSRRYSNYPGYGIYKGLP
jgi:GAF domain-containing protein